MFVHKYCTYEVPEISFDFLLFALPQCSKTILFKIISALTFFFFFKFDLSIEFISNINKEQLFYTFFRLVVHYARRVLPYHSVSVVRLGSSRADSVSITMCPVCVIYLLIYLFACLVNFFLEFFHSLQFLTDSFISQHHLQRHSRWHSERYSRRLSGRHLRHFGLLEKWQAIFFLEAESLSLDDLVYLYISVFSKLFLKIPFTAHSFLTDYFHIRHELFLGCFAFGLWSAWRYNDFWRFGDD